ncbi:hypothetical protein [Leptolyngbya sp. 7M]|uniref:hypothetical protein n=1 Tax=Leptolyngbya sp. 7M TaxID=2812896 RepID=UPI001B8D0E5E|nr:hypothetical protein [Leptolyngbya sp. 7M]QYO66266.1 hypothetical protein JVX88_05555 [Leptolyngbya sp. 7M]
MSKYISIVFIAGMLSLFLSSFALAQKLKPEEIIAKHLDSIAAANVRTARKNLIAVGDVTVDYITQKNPSATGRVVMASEGRKMFLGFSLNASDYPMEKIIYDGGRSQVDFVRPGARSDLGSFLNSNGDLLNQGLLGGTLTTAWALLNLDELRPKLSGGGTKKIDGVECYSIGYSPRGGNDLNITLYFEKDTFRHIRTEYSRVISAAIGRTIDTSARQQETRLRVVETFSDFGPVGELTLPKHYKLHYSFSGSSGIKEVSWTYKLLEFAVDQSMDPNTFAIN